MSLQLSSDFRTGASRGKSGCFFKIDDPLKACSLVCFLFVSLETTSQKWGATRQSVVPFFYVQTERSFGVLRQAEEKHEQRPQSHCSRHMGMYQRDLDPKLAVSHSAFHINVQLYIYLFIYYTNMCVWQSCPAASGLFGRDIG